MIFPPLCLNKGVEASEEKVAKCVSFVERLLEGGCAGWCERALKSPTKGFTAQQSLWQGIVITSIRCHCLQDTLAKTPAPLESVKLSAATGKQIGGRDGVMVKSLKSTMPN